MSTTLDETQRRQVTRWIEDGLKLSDIQKRMDAELGLRLTYMEVRLLVDDLRLTPKDIDRPKPAVLAAPAAPAAPAASSGAEPPSSTASLPGPTEPEAAPGTASAVRVTVDQIARPGAVVSGNVRFTDGKNASWYLDQMGRLGVAPEEKGYKPSAADVQAFQIELQNELARMGF